MAKYKPGDIVAYDGRKLRVRLPSFVGWESDAHKGPNFYDLTDVDTGQHLSLAVRELEEGIKVVETLNPDENQFIEAKTGNKAQLVGASHQSYWEQMEGKIDVTPAQRERFYEAVGVQKNIQHQLDVFNQKPSKKEEIKPTILRKLWNRLSALGTNQ